METKSNLQILSNDEDFVPIKKEKVDCFESL